MSDTPRVDAREQLVEGPNVWSPYEHPAVESDFARELEREADSYARMLKAQEKTSITLNQIIVDREKEIAVLRDRVEELDSTMKLNGSEHVSTFGGESWIDDMKFAEYGISFGDCSVHGLTPAQAISLATTLLDHLMLNGHKFEIIKTGEQDQRERLTCVDKKEIAQ